MDPRSAEIEEGLLLDVQGLFGGWDVWVGAQGDAYSRSVTPPDRGQHGLQEVRYKFALSAEERAALFDLIRKNDFFNIIMRERPGIPDEARPAIWVKTASGSRLVSKWAGVENEDFDAIWAFLLNLTPSGEKDTELYRGDFDWQWQPDGFTERELLLKQIPY
ncbi:MAG: hypothetical protein IT364_09950 [Candidatus Hydrogenedentes bacterium]|nr:hypothetical protein [Candidatus Hydrogenedentota bacterium]